MAYHINKRLEKDGTITTVVVPWTAEDYQQAIADLEQQITPRRLREAVLFPEGLAWLESVEAKIQRLRKEMTDEG